MAVATLAMVCNDLAIANSSMSRYSKNGPAALAHIARGGRMYFSRMMCGHLNEGMEAIATVRRDASLLALVNRCSEKAQGAFEALCACLRGGSEHKKFEKYVGWVRHRVAFHYGADDIVWAIKDRASRNVTGTLTAGQGIHSTRFEFADDILDSIVVRKLWRIPREKDVRGEADRIGNWCDQKCREFLQFSQEFVPLFLRAHSIIQ